MKKRVVSYLILFVIATLMGSEAIGLLRSPKPRVLATTTSLSVDQRVASLEKRVYNLEKHTGIVKSTATGPAKETFVSLMGGTVSGVTWTKLPGSDFVFDQSLYGNSVEVSWQGWMDSGYGMARIYDNTNHRVVDGSEISVTSGSKASFYSKGMSIWRGQNQYWIEVRDVAGEVSLSLPRLKVLSR